MPTTTHSRSAREDVYTKAQRILSDPSRVHTSPESDTPNFWLGYVDGDHGRYTVIAVSEDFSEQMGRGNKRVACTCKSGRFAKRLCSHMIVGEEMRLRCGE